MNFRPSFPLGRQKARTGLSGAGFPGPASTAPQDAPEAGPIMKE